MMGKIIISLCLIVLLLSGSVSATDLDQYQRFIDYQKQQLQKRQDTIDTLTLPAQKRLDALQKNIAKTESYLEDNSQRLTEIRTKLKEMTDRQATLEGVFDRALNRVVNRLRFLQRQPQAYWWIALLNSESLQQFIDRREQFRYLYQQDKKILTNLKGVAESILAQRDEVRAVENEALLIQQQLNYQQASYETEAEIQQKIIDRLQTDRRSLEIAEARLAQDSRRLASLIMSRQINAETVLPAGNGSLSYPTQGVVTSTFGWRMHPILGYEKFHSGIDFGAEQGTLIYAAAAGTVLFAGWYGGYGNSVVIDHGNGITTLYAHAESLYAEEGQVVQPGQPIATVGSTGFSTGPHLHFELRANGEPIDPAPYL